MSQRILEKMVFFIPLFSVCNLFKILNSFEYIPANQDFNG